MSRRTLLAGALGAPALGLTGCAGTVAKLVDLSRLRQPWLRGTAYGSPFGALPAGGAEIPTFLSYAAEKKLTKHKGEFGHGAIEGVAGPEAANNAAAAGVLVPLVTLGLPTSATAAISDADVGVLAESWFSRSVLVVAVLAVAAWPVLRAVRRRRQEVAR